ncbi:Uncharacterised protein [Mycobacteroides abscessus subsp. abscessus]|nr:Uncharacterised protein [Mycobacteroides abscessus subsp. abscessus]
MPHQGGVSVLHHCSVVGGDDVLCGDDVGAEGSADVVHVDLTVQDIPGEDGAQHRELLIYLRDLLVVDGDTAVLEKPLLCGVSQDAQERRRYHKFVVSEGAGRGKAVMCGVVVLDGEG